MERDEAVVTRRRLDQALVERGLAASRERARALILAGHVRVAGQNVSKAGTLVDDQASIDLARPDHPWASRGGLKLVHALDVFGLDVTGRLALDVGASAGGFTDVLLDRGARQVVALDVGRGQLDWRLRSDPRVVAIEGVNARYLRPDDLPETLRTFDLATIDVSFISARHLLPVVQTLLAPQGRVILLVKPQFEAGRGEVGPGGIVRDPAVHTRVVQELVEAAHRIGWERLAVEPSPILGVEGNREFFVLFAARAAASVEN